LERLEALDRRKAHAVEILYSLAFTTAESAEALDVSVAAAERHPMSYSNRNEANSNGEGWDPTQKILEKCHVVLPLAAVDINVGT
jgi:hypothetical protein